MSDLALRRIEQELIDNCAVADQPLTMPPQAEHKTISGLPVIEVTGTPNATLNLPFSPATRWIRESIRQKEWDIYLLIQELFKDLPVHHVETHGPGMLLPIAYGAPSIHGQNGYMGVTAHTDNEAVERLYFEYSTLGGPSVLIHQNTDSLLTIMREALQKMQGMLATQVDEQPTS